MKHFPSIEDNFLKVILQDASPLIRKEAIKLLAAQPSPVRKEGVSALLSFFNPLGIFNNLLVENINLIREAGIREAAEYLRLLREKWFLVNGDMVRRAIDVTLDKWKKHGT